MDTIYGTILLAAIGFAVFFDAKRIREQEQQIVGWSDLNPALWGFGVFALLIIILPWYLVTRPKRLNRLVRMCPGCLASVPLNATRCPHCSRQLDALGRSSTAAAAPTPAAAPAGWHPDPTSEHRLRYWDGTRWTSHTAD